MEFYIFKDPLKNMVEESTSEVLKTDVEKIFSRQKEYFLSSDPDNITLRKRNLRKLERWILEHLDDIHDAVFSDMKKPKVESDITEAYVVLNEIRQALRHLSSWMHPKSVSAPWPLFPARGWITYQPKGVCLIIAPWNFPFNLAISPFVSAIAAGNSVIIKPSEYAQATSGLIKQMISELFETEVATVVEGGPEVSQELLQLPFNHIFFTGSQRVGKLVMKAASANLSSVTLELGGKSPVIIDETADLKDAAEKIVVGKFFNSGQTCIAPDFCIVHESIKENFLFQLESALGRHFRNGDKNSIRSNGDYGRIINRARFQRLQELLNEAFSSGAKITTGGDLNENELYFSPTVITDVSRDSLVMNEEIFGPILPVITYSDIQECSSYLKTMPSPLVLYIFTKSKRNFAQYSNFIQSGAVSWNDVAFYFLHHGLPFGGINESGMGRSHGYAGFKTFSNERSVMKQKVGWIPARLVFPPYGKVAKRVSDFLLKYL